LPESVFTTVLKVERHQYKTLTGVENSPSWELLKNKHIYITK
ncbi:hypothetical protein Pcinc_008056, partial [Petrolisthes cinctipes]